MESGSVMVLVDGRPFDVPTVAYPGVLLALSGLSPALYDLLRVQGDGAALPVLDPAKKITVRRGDAFLSARISTTAA